MWKTGPRTLNDWTTGPEVLQWGNGISRGPETGSSDLRSEHQKGKKRKRRGESGTRKLAWRGGGTGTRMSRIGWARLHRPPLGLFIGGIPAPPRPPRQFKCFLITLPSHVRLWPFTQWKVRTEKLYKPFS